MIRAVIFDMYETLVTMTRSVPYKGTNIAKDLGLAESVFREVWDPSDDERTLGRTTFEERDVIKQCELWPYFDVACMSCELGMKKPQIEIFEICLEKLGLKAEECLYVGDGGSQELETAQSVGMKVAQATWYLCEGFGQLVGRKPEFEQLEKPEDVLGQV